MCSCTTATRGYTRSRPRPDPSRYARALARAATAFRIVLVARCRLPQARWPKSCSSMTPIGRPTSSSTGSPRRSSGGGQAMRPPTASSRCPTRPTSLRNDSGGSGGASRSRHPRLSNRWTWLALPIVQLDPYGLIDADDVSAVGADRTRLFLIVVSVPVLTRAVPRHRHNARSAGVRSTTGLGPESGCGGILRGR